MHPQGCQILSLDPLLFGFNHMPVKSNRPRPPPRARNRIALFEDDDENEDEEASKIGASGRTLACNLRVRSAGLYTLSYGSVETKRRRKRKAEALSLRAAPKPLIDFSIRVPPPKMVGRHGAAPCSAV